MWGGAVHELTVIGPIEIVKCGNQAQDLLHLLLSRLAPSCWGRVRGFPLIYLITRLPSFCQGAVLID